MPDFEGRWRPGRVAAFIALGLILYTGLFIWSDAVLRTHSQRNPFSRIAEAPEHVDWIILGASHALPFGFSDIEKSIRAETGRSTLTLAATGGGPFLTRLVAERFFLDHRADAVLLVVDDFAFADARWNAGRLDDADMLPKMPADIHTLAVLARSVPRGLPWQDVLAYASGFARINDTGRFQSDVWDAEGKFDSAPRPSDAADAARIAFLYPGTLQPEILEQGLAELEAVISLSQEHGAKVVLIRLPIPDRFRARLPVVAGLEGRLRNLSERAEVPMFDFSAAIPEPRYYFDTDHLNRNGILRLLQVGLANVLKMEDGKTD